MTNLEEANYILDVAKRGMRFSSFRARQYVIKLAMSACEKFESCNNFEKANEALCIIELAEKELNKNVK